MSSVVFVNTVDMLSSDTVDYLNCAIVSSFFLLPALIPVTFLSCAQACVCV